MWITNHCLEVIPNTQGCAIYKEIWNVLWDTWLHSTRHCELWGTIWTTALKLHLFQSNSTFSLLARGTTRKGRKKQEDSPPLKYVLYQNISCNLIYRWILMGKMKYNLVISNYSLIQKDGKNKGPFIDHQDSITVHFKISLAANTLKIGLPQYSSKTENKILGFLNFKSLWQFSATQLIN